MPKVRISRLQFLTILGNLVFGKAIGYSNGVMLKWVGRDAWEAMLIAFLTGMVVIALVSWLAARFGTEQPMAYLPRLLGRWFGWVAMLLLALFFFASFLTSAVTVAQHMNDYLMTETPLIIFVVVYTALVIYAAYLGVEVIGRLSVLGLGLTILLNVLMVAGSFMHLDPSRLFPMLDRGLPAVAMASVAADPDVAMATTAALMLLPLTGKPQRWTRLCWWGLGLGCLLVVTWSVFEVGVLGAPVAAQYLISCMQMARAAELSIYIHRYEMIMVVLFVYSVITQSAICLLAACDLTAVILPFRVRRAWLISVCGLLTILPQYYLAYDRERYGQFLAGPLPAFTLPIAFGIPLLLALFALFRPSAAKAGRKSVSG
jgi:spore germination protein (amino acid permease)